MSEVPPEESENAQVLELDSGTIVAFIGTRGFDGVYKLCSSKDWEFRPPGSREWDAFHQAAYRNARAVPLTWDEMKERGIPLPPAAGERPCEIGEDGDEDGLPLRSLSWSIRRKLRASSKGQWISLFLLLEEDEYETLMGDGKFRYLHATCWEEKDARRLLAQLEEEDRQRRSEQEGSTGMLYSLKEIGVLVDEAKGRILARLHVEPYDRFRLAGVFEHLGRR